MKTQKHFTIKNDFNSIGFVIDKDIGTIRCEVDNALYDIEMTIKTARWLSQKLLEAAKELENSK